MIKNFFNVAGADAVKRIAEWIRHKFYTKTQADDLLDDKVDKVSGKGLSTEDYTTAEKTKLGGIEAGAEVNVQSDWNQSDSTKDDFIKNKPTLRQPSADGTSGQYLKSNGSGNAPSWETMDTAPTANSTKAVTSGGVKTALDGKQASVTITTNANTPTDNDTVIMQDNGNTGTTSFLRRKLSTLWTYIKGKADGVYVPFGFITTNTDSFGGGKYLYNEILDSRLWGADERFNVTWNVYNIESGELVETKTAKNLFNMQDEYYSHPVDGEKEVITITPKDGSASTEIWTYCHGDWLLHFYSQKTPQSASLRWKNTSGYGGTWSETINFEPWRGSIWKATIPTSGAAHLNTMEITIIGKTNSEVAHPGTSLSNISYICNRASLTSVSAVTKFEVNQEMYGQLTAKKLITRGGTSSQYLRGDGSLTTLSTSPTSGSGLPITSGAVYTALNNKQNKFLTFDIPDNSGYATLTLISDITESLSTPNWTGHGIIGFMYGWRAGNLSGSTAQRITCWGNHDTSYVKLQTDNNNNNALKPLLVYYNSRYYLALKKGKRSGMTHYFVGFSANLLSTRINLYANSNETKWYSDSGRTTEVTFTITKDYSRYEGGYLDFMGNSSQVVLGTGELKTIDSSVASGSSNLVTSGAVATAINGIDTSGKVNLQPDFTASQIDYSAGNVGKWQKVLRFPEGADLVINMKKTAMGSDSTSTLWFSSSSMGDSYTSLFGNHSVRFVHDGGYVFLVLACRKSTYEPIESYTFQIAHSSVPMSDIVAVTEASPITATPKEPSIVYRAPITTGAVSFNVTNGAGSVAMANHNDFLGNMTSEASNGVVVTMSGATEGQIYRFVFTRNITGGVTFKQSNVAYCTISGDVNAGDTITLTAVSNTADGWLYEQESAGIESSDGSNIIEYNGSTADVRVNWEKLPANIVRNNSYTESDGRMAIAQYASAGQNAFAGGIYATAADTSVAVGYNAKTVNNFCVAVGVNAKATGQGSTAVNGESKNSYGTAIGFHSLVDDAFGGIALGYYASALNMFSMALGGYAKSVAYAIALGYYANAGYPSGNSEYPRYEVGRFTAVDFVEGGETKKYRFVDYGSSVTITLNGDTYTLTPPNANLKFFIVVNSAVAARIFRTVSGYAQINGNDIYINNLDGYDIVTDALTGNYYALWLAGVSSNFPSSLDSFSFLAYYKGTNSDNNQIALGYSATAIYKESLAIGSGAKAVASGQIVIGAGTIPNESDKLQIGNGRIESNAKKNILTIDSNERLHVRSYVGETQTIEMDQQTGSLSNITKSIYRIRWNDTGTVNLTLDTSGCVEGQRVTIFAETNDVSVSGKLIVTGRYMDFVFIAGDWRAPQDPWQ